MVRFPSSRSLYLLNVCLILNNGVIPYETPASQPVVVPCLGLASSEVASMDSFPLPFAHKKYQRRSQFATINHLAICIYIYINCIYIYINCIFMYIYIYVYIYLHEYTSQHVYIYMFTFNLPRCYMPSIGLNPPHWKPVNQKQ